MKDLNFITERHILKIGNLLNQTRRIDLKNKQLTAAQSETLLYYHMFQGNNIRELGSHLRISHQAARKLVEKLREEGYLRMQASEVDARSTSVYLTNAGLDLYNKLHDSGALAGQKLLNGFTQQEKEILLSFLTRMEENISGKERENNS